MNDWLLIPVYDLSTVNAVCRAAKKGARIKAIANPNSGPFGKKKKAVPGWHDAISKLYDAGCLVLRYIDAKDGAGKLKTTVAMKNDVAGWRDLYRGCDGYFFDDATSLKNIPHVTDSTVILNPGDKASESYAESADKTWFKPHIVTHERDKYLSRKRPEWEARHKGICVLAMSEPDFVPVLKLARERGVSHFYCTHMESGSQGEWEQLPPYFDAMCAAFRS